MPFFTSTAHASGTTSGIRIPIVPQLDPVAKAVAAASTKIMPGTTPAGSHSPRIDTR